MHSLQRSKNSLLANARATFYPQPDGSMKLARVQVFEQPKFMPAGWEEVNKEPRPTPLVAAGGEPVENQTGTPSAADLARAVRRSRRMAFDLIMCNHDLDAFVTFTYSPDAVADKSAYADCYPFLKNWLSNGVQRNGLKYLCVPELTKAGDVHFHGIMNRGALRMEEARNPHNGRLIKHNGSTVFNVLNWHAGFSTAQLIHARYDDESHDPRLAVSKYIFKYMGKNLGAKIGGRYILKGGELVHPVYAYGDGVEEFAAPAELVRCESYEAEIEGVGKYWDYDFCGGCHDTEIRNPVDSLGL